MSEEKARYNLTEFMSAEPQIEADAIPAFENEAAARAAGLSPGDVFRTPEGRFGVVGVLPPDGRE